MRYLHLFIPGLLLGWGAAIPIGPVNLEITRRNLYFGSIYGVAMGLGACLADLSYLILLSSGTLILLQHPLTLQIIGLLGALLLAWFGMQALKAPAPGAGARQPRKRNVLHTGLEGYLMTLLNPYTILFWASVSAQISLIASRNHLAAIYTGAGVMFGAVSWVLFLNLLLHHTRHRLSPKVMHRLNRFGGSILLLFAFLGVIHAFSGIF